MLRAERGKNPHFCNIPADIDIDSLTAPDSIRGVISPLSASMSARKHRRAGLGRSDAYGSRRRMRTRCIPHIRSEWKSGGLCKEYALELSLNTAIPSPRHTITRERGEGPQSPRMRLAYIAVPDEPFRCSEDFGSIQADKGAIFDSEAARSTQGFTPRIRFSDEIIGRGRRVLSPSLQNSRKYFKEKL